MSVAFSMESRNLLLTSIAGWTYAVGPWANGVVESKYCSGRIVGNPQVMAKILVNAELILARGTYRFGDKSGVDRTDAELCETIRPRQREVPHEIPNRDMGCCGLSCCEWLGGLFLSKRQGPSDRTVGVCSSSANLSHCDCRNALPREHLFVSCCKCCHVCSGRSTGGNRAAAIKPLKLIEDISVREFRFNAKSAISYWEELVREADLPGASERSNWNHAPGWSRTYADC